MLRAAKNNVEGLETVVTKLYQVAVVFPSSGYGRGYGGYGNYQGYGYSGQQQQYGNYGGVSVCSCCRLWVKVVVCQCAHIVDYGSKWSYEKDAPNWEITQKKRVSACMRRFSSGALVPVRES